MIPDSTIAVVTVEVLRIPLNILGKVLLEIQPTTLKLSLSEINTCYGSDPDILNTPSTKF